MDPTRTKSVSGPCRVCVVEFSYNSIRQTVHTHCHCRQPRRGCRGHIPPIFSLGGTSTGISPSILLRTFGYSRPILVDLRSLSLKPISFGYKTPPPIRFSQAGGQSAHKARPPNLELALMPLPTASVHQAAKLVAALLRVARVTAGLAESNHTLLPGL